MYLERAEREELNKLSKEVFGSANRWQKIVENGYSEVLMKTVKEEVPGENGAESTFIEQKVPVLSESGGKQSAMVRHTVESIRELMLGFKAQRDTFLAEYTRKQAEAKAAKEQQALQKKIHKDLTGSAL